jgi:hypothetical protein
MRFHHATPAALAKLAGQEEWQVREALGCPLFIRFGEEPVFRYYSDKDHPPLAVLTVYFDGNRKCAGITRSDWEGVGPEFPISPP